MNINDIQFDKLPIEIDHSNRGQYSRVVYNDKINNRFLKIWINNYFYASYFSYAYHTGFFNDIARIEDIIKDKAGQIMGYITTAGKTFNWQDYNPIKYNDLRQRVISSTQKHNIFYLDLTISNVCEIAGKYFIVDLEASVLCDQLNNPHFIKSLPYNDFEYRKATVDLTKIEPTESLQQPNEGKKC